MMKALVALACFISVGCGPSPQEQTLSVLNVEADKWTGGPDFSTSAKDAFDQPLTWNITKGAVNYTLELGSAGPDTLTENSDDIVVSRSNRHGESTISDEISKSSEKITEGAAKGLIKGLVGGGGGEEER